MAHDPAAADDIVGKWSIDARYPPGTMEDGLLYFSPDGRGCFWYGNLAGAEAAAFDWTIAEGLLTTITRRRYQTPLGDIETMNLGGTLTFDLAGAPVSVQIEPTPAGQQMKVLHLPQGTVPWAEDAFGFTGLHPPDWMRPLIGS